MTTLTLTVPTPSTIIHSHAEPTIEEAFAVVFGELKENTLKAYGDTIDDFAAFLELPSRGDAARELFTCSHGAANLLASRYRTHLFDQGLAAATIQTRLGCLAGIVKRMRRLGVVTWKLEVAGIKVTKLRDTAGPGAAAIGRMIAELAKTDTPLAARDTVIVELLFNPALRRAEVAALDLEDVDLDKSRLRIRGKGRDDDEFVTIPAPARVAIQNWLRYRGMEPGALIVNLDRAYSRRRLSKTSIYNVVERVGAAVGIKTHPHALRHSGGSAAAQATGFNLLQTGLFLRHRNSETTKRYIDNLQDVAGQVSNQVAANRGQ
jgi:integrase/recombinase XerC